MTKYEQAMRWYKPERYFLNTCILIDHGKSKSMWLFYSLSWCSFLTHDSVSTRWPILPWHATIRCSIEINIFFKNYKIKKRTTKPMTNSMCLAVGFWRNLSLDFLIVGGQEMGVECDGKGISIFPFSFLGFK